MEYQFIESIPEKPKRRSQWDQMVEDLRLKDKPVQIEMKSFNGASAIASQLRQGREAKKPIVDTARDELFAEVHHGEGDSGILYVELTIPTD